ncbi:MAG: hypothetical protein JXA74_06985, partial [Anaerolineae bacterium]|nr:hypothetical protein [Anaerolineae bacterium]
MFRSPNRRAERGGELIVDQMAVQGGHWQSNPAHMRAIDAASMRAHASRGDLYLLIEAPLGATLTRELCDELITTIVQTYYGLRGSTTRGLREALLSVNNLLFERNLRADSQHRSVAGISCVVMRDGDIYIAQLGPALVCVASEGVLTRYPSESIWLQSRDPSSFDMKRQPPLGLRRDVEPDLYHSGFGPGALLLLASTSLLQLASDRGLAELARDSDPQVMRQTLEQLAAGGDLSAMIVSWPDEASTASAAEQIPRSGALGAEGQGPPPDLPSSVAEDYAHVSPPWEGEPAPSHMANVDETTAGSVDELPSSQEEEEDSLAYAPPTMAEETARTAAAPRPREPLIDLEGLRDTISEGAERLREGTEEVLQRVLPDELPERPVVRRSPSQRMSLSGRALVSIALAIPLLMLFIVLMTRAQYERVREGQFTKLQSLAQARYDSAMRMQDRTLMRQELYEALAKVREGQMIQPGDETLGALERNILHRLDEVDVVTRIYHYWRLYEFDEAAVAAQSLSDSSRIVIRGVDVFLLN